jgi:hypothetical protein
MFQIIAIGHLLPEMSFFGPGINKLKTAKFNDFRKGGEDYAVNKKYHIISV